MTDVQKIIYRLAAYGSAPDVYDAPTPEECRILYLHLTQPKTNGDDHEFSTQ